MFGNDAGEYQFTYIGFQRGDGLAVIPRQNNFSMRESAPSELQGVGHIGERHIAMCAQMRGKTQAIASQGGSAACRNRQ